MEQINLKAVERVTKYWRSATQEIPGLPCLFQGLAREPQDHKQPDIDAGFGTITENLFSLARGDTFVDFL